MSKCFSIIDDLGIVARYLSFWAIAASFSDLRNGCWLLAVDHRADLISLLLTSYNFSGDIGVPVKLLYEAEGMKVTCEVSSAWFPILACVHFIMVSLSAHTKFALNHLLNVTPTTKFAHTADEKWRNFPGNAVECRRYNEFIIIGGLTDIP